MCNLLWCIFHCEVGVVKTNSKRQTSGSVDRIADLSVSPLRHVMFLVLVFR